ncbi:MAG TPA: hypothetical protein VNT75_31330 [Symbiobacteriaceae bacterium]|nr:hypothetical protein [Symbiobacteriaceae bacterium]
MSPQALIARARFLILFVQESIQSALARAQGGTVTIPETTLLAWQTVLMQAVSDLNSLPVPAIFPPPNWAQLVGMATSFVNTAIEMLAAIPVAQLRIFPPRPGQATVSTATLRRVQENLLRAAEALEAAERELAGA